MKIDDYFSGAALYGDDFSGPALAQWYEAEREGYAGLLAGNISSYRYHYHPVNRRYGYRYLPPGPYPRVLGFGSALGHEFLPIAAAIGSLDIVEPSGTLVSPVIGGLRPRYHIPAVDGHLAFGDDTFDLVVSLDTLHHIPNVSFVLGELVRSLKPGGYLLCREPVQSLGDWRQPRPGLTARERGIPLSFFRERIRELELTVVRESLFFTMTSFLSRKASGILARPLYTYSAYLWCDALLSRLTRHRICYHPRHRWQRIAPSEVFYVLCKQRVP